MRKILQNFRDLDQLISENKKKELFSCILTTKKLEKEIPDIYELIAQLYSDNDKIKIFFDKLKYFFSKNIENLSEWVYILELQNFLLKIIRNYQRKIIVLDLIMILSRTGVSNFHDLIHNFESRVFIPPKRLIDFIGKVLITIIFNKLEISEFYFKFVFDYLGSLYKAIILGYYSNDFTSYLDKIADFFELYWILLNVIPQEIGFRIDQHRGKYYDNGYEELWDIYSEYVLRDDILLKINNDHLEIIFKNDFDGTYEVEEITAFNNRSPKFKLNLKKVLNDLVYREDWFKRHMKRYLTKSDYDILDRKLSIV